MIAIVDTNAYIVFLFKKLDIEKVERKALCNLIFLFSQPFKCQPHKMIKHKKTICPLLPMNCVGMFDLFGWLVLKGLMSRCILFLLQR